MKATTAVLVAMLLSSGLTACATDGYYGHRGGYGHDRGDRDHDRRDHDGRGGGDRDHDGRDNRGR